MQTPISIGMQGMFPCEVPIYVSWIASLHVWSGDVVQRGGSVTAGCLAGNERSVPQFARHLHRAAMACGVSDPRRDRTEQVDSRQPAPNSLARGSSRETPQFQISERWRPIRFDHVLCMHGANVRAYLPHASAGRGSRRRRVPSRSQHGGPSRGEVEKQGPLAFLVHI